MADLQSPYQNVDWDHCCYLPSMSHQHFENDISYDGLYEMGYRHLAFSNYYPSRPMETLPAGFAERYPEVISSPNAEHHSLSDSSVHFNGLGSRFASGYGHTLEPGSLTSSPVIARFEGLCPDAAVVHPGQSLYRLDLAVVSGKAESAEPAAFLTVEGATACDRSGAEAVCGDFKNHPVTPGTHQFYLRARRSSLEVRVAYDAGKHSIRRLRLMQGMNRPRVVEVRVEGHDARLRPQVGIRFITAQGAELLVDGSSAVFPLEMDDEALCARRFIRVEAFAAPKRLEDGTPLTREALQALDVARIAALKTPHGTSAVEMIFSQPLRIVPRGTAPGGAG